MAHEKDDTEGEETKDKEDAGSARGSAGGLAGGLDLGSAGVSAGDMARGSAGGIVGGVVWGYARESALFERLTTPPQIMDPERPKLRHKRDVKYPAPCFACNCQVCERSPIFV